MLSARFADQSAFEELCGHLLASHVTEVADPSRFAMPVAVLHSDISESQVKQVRFADWAGRRASAWVFNYAIEANGFAHVRTFVSVWFCCWFRDATPTSANDVAHSLSQDVSAVLDTVFELQNAPPSRDARYRFNPSEVLCTVLTNLDIDPSAGDKSLLDRVHELLEDRFPAVTLQIGTSATIPFERQTRLVHRIRVTPQIIRWLADDPARLRQLDYEEFELLIADRFTEAGFRVVRTGRSNQADGGIDLFAVGAAGDIPLVVAVQAKHHQAPTARVRPHVVREFRGAVAGREIDISMIVTNAQFTKNAKWEASQTDPLIRCRTVDDIARWLSGDFDGMKRAEIPKRLELAPGLYVDLPRFPFL
jgi:hypothetical protein